MESSQTIENLSVCNVSDRTMKTYMDSNSIAVSHVEWQSIHVERKEELFHNFQVKFIEYISTHGCIALRGSGSF